MTIQLAKDQVYKKHFDKNGEMWMPTRFEYSKMDNEAAELYAASKAKEAYNQGVRDAAEVVKCGKCEMLGVLSPCDECHYHGNKKQSILKLLK